ncbi:unnamed protein product, partial [Mesorhabditis belari]|uniref:Uncharacterized protein n=1 Tax=Mesorhabditis belari TaxID=2138241 RepID=A0AAF3EQ15_9BILA
MRFLLLFTWFTIIFGRSHHSPRQAVHDSDTNEFPDFPDIGKVTATTATPQESEPIPIGKDKEENAFSFATDESKNYGHIDEGEARLEPEIPKPSFSEYPDNSPTTLAPYFEDRNSMKRMNRNQRTRVIPPDLDTLLTRAVTRVIGQERGIAQAMNVDKPNQKLLPVEQSLKMKLLAEQIVRKVERKYEDRMRESRDATRSEVDRRLGEMRDEYEAERSVIRADLEKERRRNEEKMRERERNVRHQIEYKIRERESKLEADRLTLENRLSEFLNAKEQFEFVQNEWRAKKDEEIEGIQLERERIQRKESSLNQTEERARRVAKAFAEAEKIESFERIRTLEMRITDTTKKLADAGSQNFELRQKLDEMLGIENDLSSTKDQLKRCVNENRELEQKLRSKADYQGLKDENQRLKQQIIDTIRQSGDNSASVARLELMQREHRAAEEAAQLKIRELRLALTMMNDRVKTVTQERNYLRSQLKEMRRKDVQNMREERRGRSLSKTRRNRMRSSSESTSSSTIGFSSDGDSDIREIRKRLNGLGQKSRDLDACADRFLGFRSAVSANDWESQELDDFCREQVSRKGEHERQKREHEQASRQRRVDETSHQAAANDRETWKNQQSIPAQKPARINEEMKPLAIKIPDEAPVKVEVPKSPPKEKPSFEERLRQRELQRERALGNLNDQQQGETVKREETETQANSQENPLFEGVDPVMARYMSLVMNQRKADGETKVEQRPSTSANPRRNEEIVVPSFGLDQIENDNDEIECLELVDGNGSSLIYGQQENERKRAVLSPADAIPLKFRDYCQFLEDPIHGEEGRLEIVKEPRKIPKDYPGKYRLRGLLVLTRHGERSPLTKNEKLLNLISCAPFHETDRRAFDRYVKLIESNEFRNFYKEDSALKEGFSNLPHRSICVRGQMTAEGAMQHHRLGNFFHERYWNSSLLMNDQLEVFTMTTPYNRTWQSLTAFVSGFLYPLRTITGNVYANFSSTTYLCSEHEEWCKCEKAFEWRRQYEREHVKYYQEETAALLRDECKIFEQIATTETFADPFDFEDKIFGFYSCRRQQLPCTVKGECITYELLEKIFAETTLRGETMFNRETDFIAKRLQMAEAYSVIGKVAKMVPILQENPKKNKIMLLSGHDTTVGPLLRVLRILPEDPPRYASRVVFEVA